MSGGRVDMGVLSELLMTTDAAFSNANCDNLTFVIDGDSRREDHAGFRSINHLVQIDPAVSLFHRYATKSWPHEGTRS